MPAPMQQRVKVARLAVTKRLHSRSGPRRKKLRLLILAVSSLFSDFPKNISVPIYPETLLELSPSYPTRGAYRDRHGRGVGGGGRGSVLRATGLQGELKDL